MIMFTPQSGCKLLGSVCLFYLLCKIYELVNIFITLEKNISPLDKVLQL